MTFWYTEDMKKKVYLPSWQKKFIPPLLVIVWFFVTYQQFFTEDPEMNIIEYVIMTLVFLGASTLVWIMASGKLPAYEIEEGSVDRDNS
jgi:protein-S-isoprenylcysteine O-methyltransferase Ste14